MRRRLLSTASILSGLLLGGTGAATAAPAAGVPVGWGDNYVGELGNGHYYAQDPTPRRVVALAAIVALAGGSNFSLPLRSDGTVWSMGDSGWGQLGVGTYGSSDVPVQVHNLGGVVAVAGGDLHALALKADGTLAGWGFDYYGQVGNGTSGGNVLAPTPVTGLSGVIAVAAGNGSDSSLALKSDGTVWAWGL